MKRLLAMSMAVWLITMTALPATAQNFPPGMTEQEYRYVKVFSSTGTVSALGLQKYSKVWEVLNRVVLRGRYAGVIPTPARIYFITTDEARAIPAPYFIPPGYDFSGFYSETYDGVVINGAFKEPVDVEELLHRLLSWLGKYDPSFYRTTGGYHPMMAVTQRQATQSLNQSLNQPLQRADTAAPSVLTEPRFNEIWAAVKSTEEFALWPVELVTPHYWVFAGAYDNVYYPAWLHRGQPWVAEQVLATSLAAYVVNFFDIHSAASIPIFGAVVNYVSAIVEEECRTGCP